MPDPSILPLDRAVLCTAPELGLLAIDGPDAEAFLQGQLSNDVTALAPGAMQRSSFNSAKGRMLATLDLWRDGGGKFRALVAADVAEALRKRLSMYVLRAKVAVTDVSPSHALFGVGGADPASWVRRPIRVMLSSSTLQPSSDCRMAALSSWRRPAQKRCG